MRVRKTILHLIALQFSVCVGARTFFETPDSFRKSNFKAARESEMFETIQSLIDQEGQICVPARHLTPRANLYELGMTPYTAIRLLLAIERDFRIEFPRDSLNRQTMATMENIVRVIRAAQFAPAYEWLQAA
jgi:acyl carrier protein